MKKENLERLASEKNNPCVTISMHTHRTHPENEQDAISLKKLCEEAKVRLNAEFETRAIASLLEKLQTIPSEIDVNYNMDGVHIFLSNSTKQIVKSTWQVTEDKVQISDTFAIRSLLRSITGSVEYLILLLSQSGVKLFEALNDAVTGEIRNDYFPFNENTHFHTEPLKISDPKATDNMVREFLNKVDKAVVKVHNQTNLNCVVVCTGDNYSRFMHMADKPNIYLGHANFDYNNQANHQIAAQAWKIAQEKQIQREKAAIQEMNQAVGQRKVITNLSEIYRAAKEGRGELLIAQNEFIKATNIDSAFSFDFADDVTEPNETDDITGEIAREVISKKGRAVFTDLDEIKSLGNIVLKIRY